MRLENIDTFATLLHLRLMNIFRESGLKVDYLGAVASFLCMIHCLATPIVFVAKACSLTCCAETPVWWKMIDYVFLIVSFLAIFFATKETSKTWMKAALWSTWSMLLVTIVNESLVWVSVPEHIVYLPAILLLVLHLYNQRYCKCEGTNCCTG